MTDLKIKATHMEPRIYISSGVKFVPTYDREKNKVRPPTKELEGEKAIEFLSHPGVQKRVASGALKLDKMGIGVFDAILEAQRTAQKVLTLAELVKQVLVLLGVRDKRPAKPAAPSNGK